MFEVPPAVLGHCDFDGAVPRLEFHKPDCDSSSLLAVRDVAHDDAADHLHHVVRFRRPDLRRMQLYALHNQLSLFTRHGHFAAVEPSSSTIWDMDPSFLSPVKTFVLHQRTIDQVRIFHRHSATCDKRIADELRPSLRARLPSWGKSTTCCSQPGPSDWKQAVRD